jgi:hypothetical protein
VAVFVSAGGVAVVVASLDGVVVCAISIGVVDVPLSAKAPPLTSRSALPARRRGSRFI